MLRDEKWISYAVRVLKAVYGGANSIARISHEIDGSPTYLAKVIASLRKGGLLTEQTELTRPLDTIFISELAILADASPIEDSISKYIADSIVTALSTLSVQQVLEGHGLATS